MSKRLQLSVVGAGAFASIWLVAITAGFVGQTDRLMTQETAYERTLDSIEAGQAERIQELKDQHSAIERALRADVTGLRTALNQVSGERIAVVEERELLVARVHQLESTFLETKQAQRDVLLRLAETTTDNIGAVERTIELAGLDPEMLLARAEEVSGGQGGPFVASDAIFASLRPLDENATLLDRKITRLERLQEMVRLLPLNAPMDDYRVTSDFGKRRDPVNGRLAMHSGIDFASDRRAPVLAPSGGIVAFVGWKGGYGKVVEIDHGYGVKTRLAHLGNIFVKRGQEVDYRDKLGQVGSSGRTTGPHLHYEVLIDGEPTDPMPFLRAGRHVFKG